MGKGLTKAPSHGIIIPEANEREVITMFEQIKSNIRKYKGAMVMYLSENHIEFTCEAVEWYTIGHENDFYEIDI